MTRVQLEHIIRAAAANADTDCIVVVGSQALLAAYPQLSDAVLTASIEADVFPLEAPERAILIDGAIGEHSVFHQTFGYYAHGVAPDTALLPAGWRERLIPIRNANTRGFTGLCLDPHDLAASKLAAGREKDLEFLRAMRREGLLQREVISHRVEEILFPSPEARALAEARLQALFPP